MAFLVVLVAALLATRSIAYDGPICGLSSRQQAECAPAVATGEDAPPPTAECCTALLSADAACFCKFSNAPWLPDVGVDPERAKNLPRLCGYGNVRCP